jgi:hypothetical protein
MTAESAPLLRVISGDPTPEELAAFVTVVLAASQDVTSPPLPPLTTNWGAPAGMHRAVMPAPGPGTWLQLGR